MHHVEHSPFFRYVDILLKYINVKELPDGFVKQKDKSYVLENADGLMAFGNKERMEIFFGNLYLVIKNTEKDKVIRIFLKSPDICWNIWKEDEQREHYKIRNEAIEIYRWYDVTVFDDGRCGNQMIRKGYWNEYAAMRLIDLREQIFGMTLENRIKEDYRNLVKADANHSENARELLLEEDSEKK